MIIKDELIYERCFLIKYQSANTHGIMLVKASHYEKKINKFKKAFKDCNIYYMAELVLTPEKLKEIENEIERISWMEKVIRKEGEEKWQYQKEKKESQ